MKIDKVTITGAGDTTNIRALFELTKKYPFVEWGILFSPKRTGNDNRYPSIEWIERFFAVKQSIGIKTNLSAHLCGEYTTKLLSEGILHDTKLQVTLHPSFKRFQLNFNESKTPASDRFYEFLRFNKHIKFILQNNKANAKVTSKVIDMKLENVDFLYDSSGGRGTLPESYLPPVNNFYTGYAGGLNPDNISEALIKINKVVPQDEFIWIDTETGVRTNDELDLMKVEKFLETIKNFII